jgi:predicted carbohydrate-binding protein with CBM5 and CBM33 domain
LIIALMDAAQAVGWVEAPDQQFVCFISDCSRSTWIANSR